MGLSNAIAGSLVWSRLSLAMVYIRKGFPLVDVVSLLLPFSLITPSHNSDSITQLPFILDIPLVIRVGISPSSNAGFYIPISY
jgi:hypothetical protein